MDAVIEVRRLINGYQISQAIHAAVALGLPDRFAEGPQSVTALAAASDCQPRPLYRLLRALATVGVFRELGDERFDATELSDVLRSDAEVSAAGWAQFVGRPALRQAWTAIVHSVQTGGTAFEFVHGVDVWAHRQADPAEGAAFDEAMTSVTSGVAPAVLDAYDFGRFREIVDVGGGRGGFLAAIMARWPAVRGVLFDQPHVVAGAPGLLAEAGVAQRCRILAGSFFDAVPTGADAYVLKNIVHDWPDEQTVTILRACRAALRDTALVLIVERVISGPNEGSEAAFSDLNMLAMTGGQERTEAEYASLLDAAGLRLARVVPSARGYCVIEAGLAER